MYFPEGPSTQQLSIRVLVIMIIVQVLGKYMNNRYLALRALYGLDPSRNKIATIKTVNLDPVLA